LDANGRKTPSHAPLVKSAKKQFTTFSHDTELGRVVKEDELVVPAALRAQLFRGTDQTP
jgi:hypothetical protein